MQMRWVGDNTFFFFFGAVDKAWKRLLIIVSAMAYANDNDNEGHEA